MAMLNFGGSEVSGGKCQGLAGMKCDEYHTHIAAVSNDPYERIKNNDAGAMHISFSGYYGYLPHMQSAGSDHAMDITDSVESTSLNYQNSNVFSSSNIQTANDRMMHVQFVRRKRNCGEADPVDTSKRLRKEETVGLDSAQERVLPTTNNNDFHYPRCLMERETINGKDTECSQRFPTEEHDLDLELENLLKQTHGCDLYHFYSCDI